MFHAAKQVYPAVLFGNGLRLNDAFVVDDGFHHGRSDFCRKDHFAAVSRYDSFVGDAQSRCDSLLVNGKADEIIAGKIERDLAAGRQISLAQIGERYG